MRKIGTKPIKRQCFVPGCRNMQTFMVFRTVEPWAKVVICEECARELYETITPKEVEETPKVEEIAEELPKVEEKSTVKITEKKTTQRKSAAK